MAMKVEVWHGGGGSAPASVKASFALSLLNIPFLESVKLPRFESSSCIKSSSRTNCINRPHACRKIRLGICTFCSKNFSITRMKGGVGSYCRYCISEVRSVACADTSSTQIFFNNNTEKSSSMKQSMEDALIEIDVKTCARLVAHNDVQLDSDRLSSNEAVIEERTIFEIDVAGSNYNEDKTELRTDMSTSNLTASSSFNKKAIENERLPGNPDAFALRISQGVGVPRTFARSSSLDGRQNAKVYDINNFSESNLCEVGEEANASESLQAEGYLSHGFVRMREDNDNETVLRRLLRERREAAKSNKENKLSVNNDIVNCKADTIHEDSRDLLEIDENSKTYKDMVDFQRSLSLKRHSVAKVLQDAMQASKLGPEYSKRIIASMPLFVDRILMKAVALKRKPKYSALPFSSRARLIIDRSKVVELVK